MIRQLFNIVNISLIFSQRNLCVFEEVFCYIIFCYIILCCDWETPVDRTLVQKYRDVVAERVFNEKKSMSLFWLLSSLPLSLLSLPISQSFLFAVWQLDSCLLFLIWGGGGVVANSNEGAINLAFVQKYSF